MSASRPQLALAVRWLALSSAALGTISRIVLATVAGGFPNILGFFTVQSNLFALIFLAVALARGAASGRPGALFHRLHGGVLLYILVTAIIYNALLAGAVDETGYSAFILVVNHTITPILVLADWILNHDRRRYRAADIGLWLINPVVYGVFASIEGARTGAFRYFFLDFVSPPLQTYLLQMLGVTLFFVLLATGIIGANRLIVRRERQEA
jgi:hypothetical protein